MLPEPVGSVLDLGTGCGIQAHARLALARPRASRPTSPSAPSTFAALNAAPQRHRRHRVPPRQPVRAGRGRTLRPHRLEPAVRDHPARDGRAGTTSTATAEWSATRSSRPSSPRSPGTWRPAGSRSCSATGSTADPPAWHDGLQRAPGGRTPCRPRRLGHRARGAGSGRYAETWIRDGGTRLGTPEFERLCGSLARRLRGPGRDRRRLRVRAAPPSDQPPTPLRRFERLHGPLGLERRRARRAPRRRLPRHDWQAAHDDEQLLAARHAVAGDVTEERHYWPGDDGSDGDDSLRQGGGFAPSVGVDTGWPRSSAPATASSASGDRRRPRPDHRRRRPRRCRGPAAAPPRPGARRRCPTPHGGPPGRSGGARCARGRSRAARGPCRGQPANSCRRRRGARRRQNRSTSSSVGVFIRCPGWR